MRELNNCIAKFRLGKVKVLKKLRNKRRNLALDFRRKIAAEFAKQFSDSIVFIGLPRNIRKQYKGSETKSLENASITGHSVLKFLS